MSKNLLKIKELKWKGNNHNPLPIEGRVLYILQIMRWVEQSSTCWSVQLLHTEQQTDRGPNNFVKCKIHWEGNYYKS